MASSKRTNRQAGTPRQVPSHKYARRCPKSKRQPDLSTVLGGMLLRLRDELRCSWAEDRGPHENQHHSLPLAERGVVAGVVGATAIHKQQLGTLVRTDSLLEQRGFELPVLFGLFPLEKGRTPAVFHPNLRANRSENNSLIGFSAATPLKL
jgi:hypothetical protein